MRKQLELPFRNKLTNFLNCSEHCSHMVNLGGESNRQLQVQLRTGWVGGRPRQKANRIARPGSNRKVNRRFESLNFLTPIQKRVVITKLFAPKFCAECTDRELHSSHGDPFRDHFYVYASRPKKWPRSQKRQCHKVVRTEILCRMRRSRAPQLSWRPFS